MNIAKEKAKDEQDFESRKEQNTGDWKDINKHGGASQLDFGKMQPKNYLEQYGGYISREELARHTKRDDCWTSIDGKVYDITQYIAFHPGGNKILIGAGKDGTAEFSKYG